MNGSKSQLTVVVEADNLDSGADCPCVDELVAYDPRVAVGGGQTGARTRRPRRREFFNWRVPRVN
ncbi:MAG: hypothetical protein ACQET5_05100 [Halobacteriota archaeon]|uniref:hypothetical protein n=1 Tax=Natronomonas sp. TaxID=2184060 RepID=UPI003974DE0B